MMPARPKKHGVTWGVNTTTGILSNISAPLKILILKITSRNLWNLYQTSTAIYYMLKNYIQKNMELFKGISKIV